MSELINPHDRFCKDLFARPGVAADFLANYLPPGVAGALDLSAPELVKDSFVDPELQEHFSDLLYRVRLKRGGTAFVYVLFEHKSARGVGRLSTLALRGADLGAAGAAEGEATAADLPARALSRAEAMAGEAELQRVGGAG
jgi:hypothetical protein